MSATSRPPTNRPALIAAAAATLAAANYAPAMDTTALATTGISGAVALLMGAKAVRGIAWDYTNRKRRRAAKTRSAEHGKGRFASLSERETRGLHDPKNTPLLGIDDDGVAVFAPSALPVCVVSPIGGGKTSCILLPAILDALHKGNSVFVSDIKKEQAHVLWDLLARLGFRVFFNNPANIAPFPHHNANPFKAIVDAAAQQGGDPLSKANEVALTLIPESADDKNRFFTEADRATLVVVIVTLAVLKPSDCYPANVWKSLTDPNLFGELIERALRSDALAGDLRTLASALQGQERANPEHLQSARTGAANALSVFRPSSALGSVGASEEFDVLTMRDPNLAPAAVFDVFADDNLLTFAKAYALTQTSRMQALRLHIAGRQVNFICDESTSFPVPSLAASIELQRSYRIRCILAFQSTASLANVYGERQATSIRSNSTEVYLSVGDIQTAEEISKRFGDTGIKGSSHSNLDPGQKVNESKNDQSRPFMSPDEILSMPSDKMLVLVNGMRPIMLNKLPWYETKPLKDLGAENPHERHAKSKRTRLKINYPSSATDVRRTTIAGGNFRKLRARWRAFRATASNWSMPFSFRSMIWIPIVAFAAFHFVEFPSPYLRLAYATDGNQTACTYAGFDGVRKATFQEHCSLIAFLQAEKD